MANWTADELAKIKRDAVALYRSDLMSAARMDHLMHLHAKLDQAAHNIAKRSPEIAACSMWKMLQRDAMATVVWEIENMLYTAKHLLDIYSTEQRAIEEERKHEQTPPYDSQ